MIYITTSNLSPNPQASIGSVSLTSGIATFGQVIPESQVPSGSYVKVGTLQTQNDIKTTWDDGSIRFVVLTCEPGSSGDYDLLVDSSQASPMSPPAIPDNTYVDLDIGGSVYRATCPTSHSSDKWLNGSLCVESRFEVTPILVSDGTTEHGFLNVLFDVRSYSESEYRIDVTVENCFDIAAATSATYDVDIVVNGISVFTQSSVAHYWCTRWHRAFVSGFTSSDTVPDWSKAIRAGAIPKYLDMVVSVAQDITGPTYGILGRGSIPNDMSSPGGRADIAPYPDWTARFLVHGTTALRDVMLAMGEDATGAYPVHLRQDTSGIYSGIGGLNLISLNEFPNYFWLARTSSDNTVAGDKSGIGPNIPDNAHQPSLAYVPYLLTGDRHYADEMAFWANFCVISSGTLSRNGSSGLLFSNQLRGIAWGLRNITDAASYLPDGGTKNYFTTIVNNNLTAFDTRATNDTSPFGTPFASNFAIFSDLRVSAWMENYFAWALDHAHKQGFTGGEVMLDMLLDFNLTLWNSEDWLEDYVGAAYVPVSSTTSTDDYYTTVAELFAAKYGDPPSSPNPSGIVGAYGVDYRLSFMIGIQEGKSGAQAAYDYYQPILVGNYNPNDPYSSDLSWRSGWSIEVL